MASDDPARKYIPQSKGDSKSSSDGASLNHGTFTTIAYSTAWAVAILGSVIGAVFIISSFEARGYGYDSGQNMQELLAGITIVASSWIGASGVGTLAEISRKLTASGPRD